MTFVVNINFLGRKLNVIKIRNEEFCDGSLIYKNAERTKRTFMSGHHNDGYIDHIRAAGKCDSVKIFWKYKLLDLSFSHQRLRRVLCCGM
jgi:hypothetical protein